MTATGDVKPGARPIARFFGGVAVGVMLCVVFLVGATLVAVIGADQSPTGKAPQPRLENSLSGAKADRVGAREVEVAFSGGLLQAKCRDGCDDLQLAGRASSLRLSDGRKQSVLVRHRLLGRWGDLSPLEVEVSR